MNLLPIMLNLAGRRVVVVGGGAVGLRKAQALLDAGAAVTLVTLDFAPSDIPPGLMMLRQAYDSTVLAGAVLVFACTDDRAVNARIAADARAAGAIVNAADQPEDCDFYSSAIIRDGPVVVAVGTGGASPGLAAFLADKLRQAVPARIGEFAELLSELRGLLKTTQNDSPRRMAVMKSLSNQETFDLFLSSGPEAVRCKLQELLRQP